MQRRVVCISRAAGASGEQVGRLVAERLAFQYLDEEIIERAAESVSLDPAVIRDVEERKSLVTHLLGQIYAGTAAQPSPRGSQAPAGQISFGEPGRSMPTSDDLRGLIRDVIRESAEEGEVVIVAHAASHALGPHAGALRVLVTSSLDTRAERIAEAQKLDGAKAVRALKESDAARSDYLKRFYGVDRELPTHYDLVVNTDLLSVEQAAAIVAQAASG